MTVHTKGATLKSLGGDMFVDAGGVGVKSCYRNKAKYINFKSECDQSCTLL